MPGRKERTVWGSTPEGVQGTMERLAEQSGIVPEGRFIIYNA